MWLQLMCMATGERLEEGDSRVVFDTTRLQKSNSNVILRKLRRIAQGNEELDDNKRDIQNIIH